MIALLAAVAAGAGMYLLYTSLALGWRHVGRPPRASVARPPRFRAWLTQAGLPEVEPREFAAVSGAVGVAAAVGAHVLFGGAAAPLATGVFAALLPVGWYRQRREARRAEAAEAWPRLIEEIRVLTAAAGRSIPQALFDAGRRAPDELREAFVAAEREWLLSTDFARCLDVLKEQLADATADATCETLLVAHDVGGGDLDRRLAALAEDRLLDLQGRKDARAEQAGVRFARRFVLVVPVGMAIAGLSIGTGRAAYAQPTGQVAVVVGVLSVVACWVWAGALLRLPGEDRVFPAGRSGGRSA